MYGRTGDTGFADDALFIDEQTTVEEVQDFLRKRAENPIEVDGTLVFDFNGHRPDMQALERAVDEKLRGNKYMIPFQVAGTWGFMYHLLPDSLKEAEILVYNPRDTEYFAYQNFYPTLPPEVQDDFRGEMSRLVNEHLHGGN